MEHLVYSDGLATVSVFVEKIDPNTKPGMEGLSNMGAVHAYVMRADGHQVTTVGEVPAETITLIAKSRRSAALKRLLWQGHDLLLFRRRFKRPVKSGILTPRSGQTGRRR